MKIAVRTFAFAIVLAGLAAGALAPKGTTGTQVISSRPPTPTCPLDNPDGCTLQ